VRGAAPLTDPADDADALLKSEILLADGGYSSLEVWLENRTVGRTIDSRTTSREPMVSQWRSLAYGIAGGAPCLAVRGRSALVGCDYRLHHCQRPAAGDQLEGVASIRVTRAWLPVLD